MYAFENDAPNFFTSILGKKGVDDNHDEKNMNEDDQCLITFESFEGKEKVTLECGHSFLYGPLFDDIFHHKSKHNLSEMKRVEPNQIRCPYCRHLQNSLLSSSSSSSSSSSFSPKKLIYGVNTCFQGVELEIIDPFVLEKEVYKIRTSSDFRWSYISQCNFKNLRNDDDEEEDDDDDDDETVVKPDKKIKCGARFTGIGQTWICEKQFAGKFTKLEKKVSTVHLCMHHCMRSDIPHLLQRGIVLDIIDKKRKSEEDEEYGKKYRCSFVLEKGANKGKTCRNKANTLSGSSQKCHLHI